jgi:nucleotide-binding universal stress UspA family protein
MKTHAGLWRTILVPSDFSQPADAALTYALMLAHASGATLHLCHIVPVPHVLDALYERGYQPPESVKRIHQKARQHVKTITQANVGGKDVAPHIHFGEGDVVAGVLEWVTKLKPDLIVMGTHGRKGAKRFFMGSVAEAIVRRSPCPVLTLRGESAESS